MRPKLKHRDFHHPTNYVCSRCGADVVLWSPTTWIHLPATMTKKCSKPVHDGDVVLRGEYAPSARPKLAVKKGRN